MLLMLKGLFLMLNNRGQSLVLFVITLPILLIILVIVIDIGRVISLKQELNNISELVLDYGLDYWNGINMNTNDDEEIIDSNLNIDIDGIIVNDNSEDVSIENDVIDIEDRLIEIIKLNKDDIDFIDVRIEDNKIYIELSDRVDGIFSSIIDISVFDIRSSYVGYIDNNEKRIERVNG